MSTPVGIIDEARTATAAGMAERQAAPHLTRLARDPYFFASSINRATRRSANR